MYKRHNIISLCFFEKMENILYFCAFKKQKNIMTMKHFMMFVLLVMGLSFVACDNNDEGDFKVVISSDTNVELGMYADEVTISYEIQGICDECANVSFSDDSWLRVKEHEPYSLTISVADNETGAGRMAAVTLSYGGSSATVVINQSGEATKPIITSLSGEEIAIERMGTKVYIEYTLENTNDRDYIYVKTDADWIYSINTATQGVVELGVATNTTKAMREAEVTVGYGVASFTTILKQRGDGEASFSAPIMSGEYLGDALTPGVANYWFILSDRGFKEDGKAYPSATYYRIDAYGDVYSGYDSMVPIANGTYTFDAQNTLAKGTFTAQYSGYWVTNKNGNREGDINAFESGSMVVENGKITLDVVINGESHHVEYIGKTLLEDNQGSITIYTTLDGDYEADLSNHTLIYECYGDYYEFGYTNWMIVIQPNDGEGDCFQFDFITDKKTESEGFIGEYVSSDFLAINSFIPGWTDGVNLLCSWFFTADQSELAPFRGGKMSIKDNGDGTITVDIDVKDDLRNRITATWTGTPIKA